jgi:Protein of unknown function (DUF4238)
VAVVAAARIGPSERLRFGVVQPESQEPAFIDLMSQRDAFLSSPAYGAMESVIGGDRKMHDSSAKRHHFVPQMVLRNFGLRNDADRIVQLDLKRGAPRPVLIESAASRRRFYRLTDEDGTRHQRLEAWFAEVEGHAAEAIRRLFADPAGVARADAATISYFVAMLLIRTPAAMAAEFVREDQAMRIKLAWKLADAQAFTSATGAGEEERQRTLQDLRDGSIAYPDEQRVALKAGFDRLGSDSQLVYQLRWTLLRSAEASFVTSDRGVAMVDETLPWPWTGNVLNSSPGAQTTVPLSSQACLLLEPAEPKCGRLMRDLSSVEVDAINLRTYGWADRHLFADSQVVLDRLRRLAKARPGRVPRPRPTRNVIVVQAHPADNRFAQANVRRGWPARVPIRGAPHDYRVLDADENPVDVCLEMAGAAVRRGGGGALRLEVLPQNAR